MKKQIEGVIVDGVKGVRFELLESIDLKITDHAEAIHKLKQRGIPLSDNPEALAERHSEAVETVVQEHALFALALIEACYNGDQKVFNALYRQFDPKKRKERMAEKAKIKHPDSALAVITTARELGRTPTAKEVSEFMKSKGKSGEGLTVPKQIEKNLAKRGYEKLPADKGKGRPKKSDVLSAHSSGKTTKRKKR
jgi:hypothetical protein